MDAIQALADRIAALERANRRQRVLLFAVVLSACVVVSASYTSAQSTDPLRVRGLVVEDENGRQRIVLGRMDSASASTRGLGMRINDATGAERFGLSLNDQGTIGMGFDAPPGTGDDRNRERINIVADNEGGAFIAMKDRRTGVVGRLYLDPQNRAWLQFSDFTQTPAVIRRWGLTGEETLRPSAKP
jgi:hypothetical protein